MKNINRYTNSHELILMCKLRRNKGEKRDFKNLIEGAETTSRRKLFHM